MRPFCPLLFVALSLAFAPAPFPRAERRPVPLAGAWDANWGGEDVRLDLRPDGSARFEYTNGNAWDGSWKCDPRARRVELTLIIRGRPLVIDLAFTSVGRDAAEGRIEDLPTSFRPLKLARSTRK